MFGSGSYYSSWLNPRCSLTWVSRLTSHPSVTSHATLYSAADLSVYSEEETIRSDICHSSEERRKEKRNWDNSMTIRNQSLFRVRRRTYANKCDLLPWWIPVKRLHNTMHSPVSISLTRDSSILQLSPPMLDTRNCCRTWVTCIVQFETRRWTEIQELFEEIIHCALNIFWHLIPDEFSGCLIFVFVINQSSLDATICRERIT